MHFGTSVFNKQEIIIPANVQIIFVADMFVDDYVGGAELTTEALIDSSPFVIYKLHSKELDMTLLQNNRDKYWIFGNFSSINPNIIPVIVGNIKYSILEYDYKYCKYRSPEKHMEAEKNVCNCHNENTGKLISAFYYGARSLFWMSEKQKEKYLTFFPFLEEKNNIVLSSVFSHKTLEYLKELVNTNSNTPKSGWIVLGSPSWVKGMNNAVEWCKTNNKNYEVVWNLPYDKMLEKLSIAEGFVYLPSGADTCPRMVIEAKLLGCELQLNNYVQHAKEDWFDTTELEHIHDYLLAAHFVFWNNIGTIITDVPSLSGYSTTYNCVSQNYPFEECINSMLQICDEVCIVDGGSTDGTLDLLLTLAKSIDNVVDYYKKADAEPFEDGKINWDNVTQFRTANGKLNVKIIKRDWSSPRFAVFDGLQKAEARAMCTKQFCIQLDSDEIIHEDDYDTYKNIIKSVPDSMIGICMPVVEYWGTLNKVRVDIQPWKWRISRNLSNITHGIPGVLRKFDSNGDLYASQGTDGCDLIDKTTLEPIQFASFYTQANETLRQAAMQGNAVALQHYENWYNELIKSIPAVYHFSWYKMERKISTYKNYWGKHWKALYDIDVVDTADNNMMFDKPWSDVTDEDISKRATEFRDKLGGFIWHKKWDGITTTPHIKITKQVPAIITNWLKG